MKNLKLPIKEFEFSFSRSSGAGGQNVNKVNSKVTLKWNIKKTKFLPKGVHSRLTEQYKRLLLGEDYIQITSQRFRDQGRNIADCISKLEDILEKVWKAPKSRRATKPTKSSVEKRLKNKKGHSDKKKMRQKLL